MTLLHVMNFLSNNKTAGQWPAANHDNFNFEFILLPELLLLPQSRER